MKLSLNHPVNPLSLVAAIGAIALVSCGGMSYDELRNPTSSYTESRSEAPQKPEPKPEKEPEPEPEVVVKKEEPAPEPVVEAPEEKPEKKKEVAIEDLDLSGDFPTATPVEGKEGIVISPHSNKEVDVTGVPSGSLIADPRYPIEDRKWFFTP